MSDPEAGPEYQAMVRRFLRSREALSATRLQSGPPGRPALWSDLAGDLGVVGLLVEERLGGQGATLRELGGALIEAGASGWSGPLVPTAGVAVHLLQALDADDQLGRRAAIASGESIVVPALHEGSAGTDLVPAKVQLHGGGSQARVTGEKLFVDGGMWADAALVSARRDVDGTVAVVLVQLDGPGVRTEAMESLDASRGLARLHLEHAPATLLPGGDASCALEDAWLVGALLVAADSVGLGSQAMDLSRQYALNREQFGRAIATFQSIKHKLVDMYVDLQTAESAVMAALADAADRADGWRTSAAMAKARAGDAVTHVVREAIQVHGGIGFTWEHELSHHFRRATSNRGLYGTPAHHRVRVAAELGL